MQRAMIREVQMLYKRPASSQKAFDWFSVHDTEEEVELHHMQPFEIILNVSTATKFYIFEIVMKVNLLETLP